MSILGAVAAAVLFVLRAVLILLGVVLALALLGLVIPFCADVAWEGDPEGETDGTLEVRAGALGLHLGLALMALGIAFSGPYKQEADHSFAPGDSMTIGDVTVTLKNLFEGTQPGYHFLEAQLEVRRADAVIGELTPQRRIYDKFGNMQFTEVDVIPGLGNEVYASLLGLDQEGRAYVKISLEPLVNWLWIGGTLLCLFPLLMLRRRPDQRRPGGKR